MRPPVSSGQSLPLLAIGSRKLPAWPVKPVTSYTHDRGCTGYSRALMSDELRQSGDQDFGADTERFRKFARSEDPPAADPKASGGFPISPLVIVAAAVLVLLVLVALFLL